MNFVEIYWGILNFISGNLAAGPGAAKLIGTLVKLDKAGAPIDELQACDWLARYT